MDLEIHATSIETMNEDAFHWEWSGVFNPAKHPMYGFEARANLILGRNPGRGHMYSVPTREDGSGELLNAWITIPSFSNEMMVKEDNEPNRKAVMSFFDPVFHNLELRENGLAHEVVHHGSYGCSHEMRWDINEDSEDIRVHDKLFRSKTFLPKHIMVFSTAKNSATGLVFDGSLWMWGNGKNESWLPQHGSHEWRFSGEELGRTSGHSLAINPSKRYPDWATPYVHTVAERALALQKSRDAFLT